MRLSKSLLKCALFAQIASSLILVSHSSTAWGQVAATASPPGSDLSEIVVTAQKRVEKLKDVPASITAISGATLDQRGVSEVGDLIKDVPGVMLVGAAGPGTGTLIIRGISTGGDRNSSTAVYLDDIQLTPNSTRASTAGDVFDPSVLDIDQVEVLKGPQSTLYGASSLGGVIKYISKQPDLETFGGSYSVGGTTIDGGGAGYNAKGTVNLPLIEDEVALRVAASYRDDPGFIDNSYTHQKDINRSATDAVKASLLIAPTSYLKSTFTFFDQTIRTDGPSDVFLNSHTLKPDSDRPSFSSPFRLTQGFDYRDYVNNTAITLPFATLTNIVSYAKFIAIPHDDFSLYGSLLGSPQDRVIAPYTQTSGRTSDEIRLTSNPGGLEWLIGAFYTNETVLVTIPIRGTNSAGQILPSSDPFYNVYSYDGPARYLERSVFGDVTYHINDQLDVTAGIRHSSSDQVFKLITTGVLGINNLYGTSSDNANNYLGTITYKPIDQLSLYARAASAYQPGGPNALNAIEKAADLPTQFGPSTLWNYEVGVKGSVLENRLNFSLAAYDMDWKNIQLTVITAGATTIGNAGKATSQGVEASWDYDPFAGLVFSGSLACNDARIKSTAPAIGATNGDPLPFAPHFTSNLSVDYKREVTGDVIAAGGLTFSSISNQVSAYQNRTHYPIKGYETLDGRASLSWRNYSLTGRLTNILNRQAVTNIASSTYEGGPLVGTILRPRTFTMTIAAKF
jgi:outer membrane receptor protein involved in Fe transport